MSKPGGRDGRAIVLEYPREGAGEPATLRFDLVRTRGLRAAAGKVHLFGAGADFATPTGPGTSHARSSPFGDEMNLAM